MKLRVKLAKSRAIQLIGNFELDQSAEGTRRFLTTQRIRRNDKNDEGKKSEGHKVPNAINRDEYNRGDSNATNSDRWGRALGHRKQRIAQVDRKGFERRDENNTSRVI